MAHALKNLRLAELSLVDRPANKSARVTLFKRDFSQDERDRLAGTGAAMEDGSFPIQNTSDLKNAIHAIGRAKDPAKAKAHIISRARSLGATDLLPDGWVSKSNHGHEGENDMTEAELKKQIDEAVKAATADLQKKLDEANDKIAKMGAGNKKKPQASDAEDAADGGDDEASEKAKKRFEDRVKAEVEKRLAAQAEIAKSDETFESEGVVIRKSEVGEPTFKLLKSQADKLEIAEFSKRAEGEFKHLPGETVAKAKAIRAVSKLGKEDREAIEAMLKAGDKAMSINYAPIGKDGSTEGSAQAQIEKLAETRATEKKITKAAAMVEVLDTSEGKDLYAKAEQEKRAA